METVLTNAYTHLHKKSKLFKTNSIAIGTKELLQRKVYVKETSFFFLQNGILKSLWVEWMEATKWYGNSVMEIKCIYKTKILLFWSFTKPVAFFCLSKNINWRK